MSDYNGMKRARDWVGQRVELTREIGNGYCSVPEGYVGTITQQSSSGLTFEGAPCKCCGVKPRITRLGYYSVRLAVDQEAPRALEELPVRRPKAELIQRFDQMSEVAEDAAVGRKWRMDSSIETWFPISAEEIERLRAENMEMRSALNVLTPDDAPQRVDETLKILMDALEEIADIKNLTATPQQFARHLQRAARAALKKARGEV